MQEEIIYNRIKGLTDKQLISFGLTCFHRVKHFYQDFEKNNDLSTVDSKIGNGNHLVYMEKTLEELKKEKDLPSNFFTKNINLFELGIVDDDYFGSSVENYSAQLAAIIATDILEFSQNRDKENIINCVGGLLEIINQNKSDLFYSLHPNSPTLELNEYLQKHYEIEFSIENSILNMIEENSSEDVIILFCNENEVR